MVTARGMQVTVVGAGFVGASIAFHLTRFGARVRVVDREPNAGLGASGASFGWVNLVHGRPSEDLYRLRLAAVEDFEQLNHDLGGTLIPSQRGSIAWEATPEATRARFEMHRSAGATMNLIDASRVAELEPHLTAPPELAIHSPHDFAIDAEIAAKQLLDAASADGAQLHFNEAVVRLRALGGRVSGVETTLRTWPTDSVVLANGIGINGLLAEHQSALRIHGSPAALLRFACNRRLLNGIVDCPDIEIRQSPDMILRVSEGAPASHGERQNLAQRSMDTIARLFSGEPTALLSLDVKTRPMTGGYPIAGFLKQLAGVYVVVGHPGIILGPLLGSLAAQEIMGRDRHPLLHSFCPV